MTIFGASVSMALAACAFAIALAEPHPAQHKAPKQAAVHTDPGERAFQANCSRCHDAPEQLSPDISGTVARHMRVRANLSAADERNILRYLGQ